MKYFLLIVSGAALLTSCSKKDENIVALFNTLEDADASVFVNHKLFKPMDGKPSPDILISISTRELSTLVSLSRDIQEEEFETLKQAADVFSTRGFRMEKLDKRNIVFMAPNAQSIPRTVKASNRIQSLSPKDLVAYFEKVAGETPSNDFTMTRRFTCEPGEVSDFPLKLEINAPNLDSIENQGSVDSQINDMADTLRSFNINSFESVFLINTNSEGNPYFNLVLPAEIASLGKMYMAFANVKSQRDGEIEAYNLEGVSIWGRQVGNMYVVTSSRSDLPKSVDSPPKNAITVTISPGRLVTALEELFKNLNAEIPQDKLPTRQFDHLALKSIRIVAPFAFDNPLGIDTSKFDCKVKL